MDEYTYRNGPHARALEEELKERNRELTALNELALAVGSSLNLDETLRIALEKTLELVAVTRGGIALLDRDGTTIVAEHSAGLPEHALTGGLAGRCVERGTALLAPGIGTELTNTSRDDGNSAVCVPVKSGGRVVGVLAVLGDRPRKFSQRDVALLTAVASQIGPAVDNSALFAELSAKVVEVTALNGIVHSISRRLHLTDILYSCLAEMGSLVPFEHASVILVSEEDPDEGVVAAVAGPVPTQHAGVTVSLKDTVLAQAMDTKRSVIIEDLADHKEQAALELRREGIKSVAIVPLSDEEHVVGTLNVGSAAVGTYGARHVSVLESAAGHLSIAVLNARLYESLHRRTLELEALARETQHRVQNNLQMISGLVSMIGADMAVPPKSVTRCLNQIQAISVIHEMLSSEHDTGAVGLRDSIDRIARMAAVAASGEKCVSVEVSGDNVRLSSKYASAVGIAVNEFVTNAIEHGFAGRNSGRIIINISSTNGLTEVLVQDDGNGLPEGFTLDKAGKTGLSVIDTLLRQGLGGTLELKTDHGTIVKISFRS